MIIIGYHLLQFLLSFLVCGTFGPEGRMASALPVSPTAINTDVARMRSLTDRTIVGVMILGTVTTCYGILICIAFVRVVPQTLAPVASLDMEAINHTEHLCTNMNLIMHLLVDRQPNVRADSNVNAIEFFASGWRLYKDHFQY